MTHRQIVIGDVHGHYDTLMTLLNAIAPSEEDRVYFLGDLIDRGPKSAQVVEFVKEGNYICLLGNHEQMVLEILGQGNIKGSALQAWLYSGGYSTVNSYGEDGISQEHLDWMRTLPTHLDLGDFWLVHAGVHPRLPLEKQTSEHFCWIRDEFHGMEEPYFRNKTIVTGHTITFTLPGVAPGKIAQGRGWLGIDTGAYHPKSGWLTGLDLTNSLIYQVHAFDRKIRKMPLEKAVTRVEPSHLSPRRSLLKL